jgi:hypothetical protein
VCGQRDRRQAQTGRPSLGAFVQRGQTGIRQRDPAGTEQRAGFVEGETEIGPAQLGQPVRDPQAMQTHGWLLACREHHPQLRRQPCEEQLQPGERVFRVELVHVVDHQHERLLEFIELG